MGDPFILKWACLATTSINKLFQTSHITSDLSLKIFYAIANAQHRRGNGGG